MPLPNLHPYGVDQDLCWPPRSHLSHIRRGPSDLTGSSVRRERFQRSQKAPCFVTAPARGVSHRRVYRGHARRSRARPRARGSSFPRSPVTYNGWAAHYNAACHIAASDPAFRIPPRSESSSGLIAIVFQSAIVSRRLPSWEGCTTNTDWNGRHERLCRPPDGSIWEYRRRIGASSSRGMPPSEQLTYWSAGMPEASRSANCSAASGGLK